MVRRILENPQIWCIDIPLPNSPLRNLNSYILCSRGQALIIDTGFNMPECLDAMRAGLKELHINMQDVSLYITHLHADHMGLASYFQEQGCRIYMSETDFRYYMIPQRRQKSEALYLKEGVPAEELARAQLANPIYIYAPEDFTPVFVHDGDEIRIGDLCCTCLAMPGHTPGNTCLYLGDEQIMFLGDHVLYTITPNITAWWDVENALLLYMNSLARLKGFPMRLALPAHREIEGGVYVRIDEILAHHERRFLNILEILVETPRQTAYQIASRMRWKIRGAAWDEFPPQQKIFAVGETMAHLDYLRETGKVIRELDGEIYRFEKA